MTEQQAGKTRNHHSVPFKMPDTRVIQNPETGDEETVELGAKRQQLQRRRARLNEEYTTAREAERELRPVIEKLPPELLAEIEAYIGRRDRLMVLSGKRQELKEQSGVIHNLSAQVDRLARHIDKKKQERQEEHKARAIQNAARKLR